MSAKNWSLGTVSDYDPSRDADIDRVAMICGDVAVSYSGEYGDFSVFKYIASSVSFAFLATRFNSDGDIVDFWRLPWDREETNIMNAYGKDFLNRNIHKIRQDRKSTRLNSSH